jgi:hypothetical protein
LKLAALVVKLNNDDHDRTAYLNGIGSLFTDRPLQETELVLLFKEALRSAKHELRHYLKRLKIGSFPSLKTLNDPETLRLAVEVDLPQIKSNIEECKRAVNTYAKLPSASRILLDNARAAWSSAHEWTEEALSRFREQRLNIDQKQPARKVNFKPWSASREVNVYEFFSKFEEWSAGTLSENQKAYRLYNTYLDPSITGTYEELRSKKNDYRAMKAWMVTKWGAVKPVADAYLRNIKKLPQPKNSTDYHGQATYARLVYKQVSDLIHLEAAKGQPVPKLQEHLQSNSFLMDLYNILPHEVKEMFGRRLAEEDEELSNIEGQTHLTAMLKELKLHYGTVKTAVSNTPLPPPPPSQKGKQAQAAHSTSFNKQPPRPGNPNNGYGKWQGQNAQQPNKKGNHNAPKSPRSQI